MTKRYIPVLAVLACLSVAGGPAFATDDPPPDPTTDTTPADTTPTDAPATDTTPASDDPAPSPASDTPAGTPAPAGPAGCVDTKRPRTRVTTTSTAAVRKHMLRGVAVDTGCTKGGSLAAVSVSISLKRGTKCLYVTHSAVSRRTSSCKTRHWMSATGTKSWRVRLPRLLPHGTYQVSTRAVDAAGNVERAHARRLAIRQTRSTAKKK
jgi:hypothetical protein